MQKFWGAVNREYELPPEHLHVLEVTCEQYDLSQKAREAIERDGLVTNGRRHPLITVQSKSMELFLRGVHDLGLEEISDGTPK